LQGKGKGKGKGKQPPKQPAAAAGDAAADGGSKAGTSSRVERESAAGEALRQQRPLGRSRGVSFSRRVKGPKATSCCDCVAHASTGEAVSQRR